MYGYYTEYSYYGWDGKCYRPFATEQEYREWYNENVF